MQEYLGYAYDSPVHARLREPLRRHAQPPFRLGLAPRHRRSSGPSGGSAWLWLGAPRRRHRCRLQVSASRYRQPLLPGRRRRRCRRALRPPRRWRSSAGSTPGSSPPWSVALALAAPVVPRRTGATLGVEAGAGASSSGGTSAGGSSERIPPP